MISQATRKLHYCLAAIPMRLNGIIYKAFRAPSSGLAKVHLGPGKKNYLPGWINLEANRFTAKVDVWANLLNPLPFRSNSIDVFYSHHVVEHLPDAFLPFHFRELYRCLKTGGFIRVGGPHAENAARKLLEGDSSWFSDFPDARSSIGGRFANFILCRGEHLTILTASYLRELLAAAGFAEVCECKPKTETFHSEFIDESVLINEWESTPDMPHTLIIEASKPQDTGIACR